MDREYRFKNDRPEEGRRVRFDGTVTLGNVLTMIGGLVLAAGAYVDYRLTVDRHEIRITANETAIREEKVQRAETQKLQTETTRALDRLTWQIQQTKP